MIMKEQKESFVFYKGFREAINALPQEYQLKTLQYLMDYAFDGTEPEENGVEKALFLSFKPQIDASQKRYQTVVANGQKGGRPKKENKQQESENNQQESENNQNTKNQNQQKPNTNLNDNDNDNDNVNDNDNSNQNEKNNPPNPIGDSLQKQLKTIRDSFVFTEALHNKVNDWLDYKKEKRQPYKPKGLQSLLSQIQQQYFQYGEQSVISIINLSMANNYEGILWAKIAEVKPCYEKTVSEIIQKPQKYGDIL